MRDSAAVFVRSNTIDCNDRAAILCQDVTAKVVIADNNPVTGDVGLLGCKNATVRNNRIDGTLRRRFAGTPLQGKVWAKTGTLNATNALSGYLQAASGRELTFSVFANDVPDGANAVPVLDALLGAIAAAN